MDTFELRTPSKAAAPVSAVPGAPYTNAVEAVASVSIPSKIDPVDVDPIAEAARAGDRQALRTLYDLFKDRVFGTALLLLSSREAAQSVTEEVFARYPHATSEAPFELWTYRSVVTCCLRYMVEGDSEIPRQRLSIDASDRGVAIRRRIAGTLADLEPSARVAFVLREGQDLSYERIAKVMDEPVHRIACHLVKAREAVAGVLEEIEFDGWNGHR